MSDVSGAKVALRRNVQAARSALSNDDRRTAAAAIRETLLDEPWVQMSGLIALYWSFGVEPPTHGLVYALWKHGATVMLPIVRDGVELDWAAYEGPDSLRPAAFGLMEPVDAPLGADAIRTAALVIVPALAVSSTTGVRLGRGGGFYDRALDKVGPNVPTVALLYDGELRAEVPAEPHDQPVRIAVTPRGLHRLQDV